MTSLPPLPLHCFRSALQSPPPPPVGQRSRNGSASSVRKRFLKVHVAFIDCGPTHPPDCSCSLSHTFAVGILLFAEIFGAFRGEHPSMFVFNCCSMRVCVSKAEMSEGEEPGEKKLQAGIQRTNITTEKPKIPDKIARGEAKLLKKIRSASDLGWGSVKVVASRQRLQSSRRTSRPPASHQRPAQKRSVG